MTGKKPLDIKRFERKIETEGAKFHTKFKGKKYILGVDTLGNIKGCETADKEIIKWLKDKGFTHK